MKRISIFCLTILIAASASAQSYRIAGSKLSSYTIVYSSEAEDEVGMEAALKLQKAIKDKTGTSINILSDNTKKASSKEILIGKTNRSASLEAYRKDFGPFEYGAFVDKGSLVLCGGGCWAIDKAGELVTGQIAEGGIGSRYREEGSIEGEFLFDRDDDTNLRIFDDNVWDYNGATSPEIWNDLGVECTNAVRGPQFAQLVRAYMPDVMGFQEFSRQMTAVFKPLVEQYGYVEAFIPEGKNDTPLYYNSNTVELIDVNYVLYTPEMWSNNNSKSYTAGIFKLKENGRIFALISTHLWWKSEEVQPGSDLARASQVRLVMAQAEAIKAKYDCPVFVVGDMNCTESSTAIRQFLDGGYKPCYKIATGSTDMHNGHHLCFPDRGFSRSGGDRTRTEAIDHCLLYNGGDTEIRNFKCEMAEFTIKLTDHYPNIVDVKLK